MTAASNYENEDMNPFRVTSRREIIALLRSIGERNQLVRMVLNQGADTVVTSILDVDDSNDTVLLDCAPTQFMNERVLESQKLSFETMLDSIRILFSTGEAESCEHEGLPAFIVPLPDYMIRLQRREFYRVQTPVTNPVLCTIPVKTESEPMPVVASLYNISAGGIALMDDKKLIDSTFGRVYDNCRIDLPTGPVAVSLQIRNVLELSLPNGRSTHRLGCQFINPSNAAMAAIQKYITKLERDRNAKATGLG
ncbi:flagellar brake protein [uncultured Oxalicibacterium sp.]|uniref:flagellar brake protein n=1 Tax=uncultured Oxalicibacterium sp. TaxID=1168540 RepID=UPI0025F486FF|nr:flagellar brake protein [uncultured Oxalicibacterium sp.]